MSLYLFKESEITVGMHPSNEDTALSPHASQLNPMKTITKNFAYWVLLFVYKLKYLNNGVQTKFLVLIPCPSLNFKALKYAENCLSLFVQLF